MKSSNIKNCMDIILYKNNESGGNHIVMLIDAHEEEEGRNRAAVYVNNLGGTGLVLVTSVVFVSR